MQSILSTKLYIPKSRSKLVLRQRLIDKLNIGLGNKLTLISAPAGFGKTTIVTQWLNTTNKRIAWLSLDVRESDSTQFLIYLVASLRTIFEDLGDGLENIINNKQTSNEAILTVLINEISCLDEEFIFVLDDYHLIESEEVQCLVAFILEHQPPQMKIVMTTRQEPKLSLAKFRVRNELLEINIDDLRFNVEEASSFFSNVMNLELSKSDIDTLEKRTEGWAAGLQLSALSLQRHPDKSMFISSFSGTDRFITDYLIEEVLRNKNENVKKFLFYTSILEQFSAPLCDTVLADTGISSQAILEDLERENTFIFSLDNHRIWYRYHHLFKDLLQQNFKAMPDYSLETLKELHRRAAKWYFDNAQYMEAFQHSIKGEDFDLAAKLLEAKIISSIMDSRIAKVNKSTEIIQADTWVEMFMLIPDKYVLERPLLISKYIWGLLFLGKVEEVSAVIKQLEEMLFDISENGITDKYIIDDTDEFKLLNTTIISAKAFLSLFTHDSNDIIKDLLEVLNKLTPADSLRIGEIESVLGLSYWKQGDLQKSKEYMSRSIDTLIIAENLVGAVLAVYIVVELLIIDGKLNEALDMCEEYLSFSFEKGEFLQLAVPILYLSIARIKLEKWDLDAANENIELSRKHGNKISIPDWEFSWQITKGKYLMIIDKLEEAESILREAEKSYIFNPVPYIEPIECLVVLTWLKQKDDIKLLNWMNKCKYSLDNELDYESEFAHIILFRVYFYLYTKNKVSIEETELKIYLDRLISAAKAGKRLRSLKELLIIKAMCNMKLGNTKEAYQSIYDVISLDGEHEDLYLFLSEGKELYKLLIEAYSKKRKPEYVIKILNTFDNKEGEKSEKPKKIVELIEPLNEREIEILHLISEGYSNKQIAKKLFLAISTIKGYNQNMFQKLNVKRRTEAVARAKELNLI